MAKDLGVSRRTVPEYIDLLSRVFLITVLNYVDINTGDKAYGRLIKAHFTDPFICRVISYGCVRGSEESIQEGYYDFEGC